MTDEQADAIVNTIFDGFQKVADAIENATISEHQLHDIVYALEAIQDKLTNINETMKDRHDS